MSGREARVLIAPIRCGQEGDDLRRPDPDSSKLLSDVGREGADLSWPGRRICDSTPGSGSSSTGGVVLEKNIESICSAAGPPWQSLARHAGVSAAGPAWLSASPPALAAFSR